MKHWLGVVCRDHVRRGTGLGIAQLGHGRRDALARLARGDWLVYYSPRTSLRGGAPLQACTAIGEVPDDEIWQAHEGDFHPWRRRVRYLPDVAETPIRALRLDLTAAPNWGHQLRRGLIQLSAEDFAVIRGAMLAPASPPPPPPRAPVVPSLSSAPVVPSLFPAPVVPSLFPAPVTPS